MKVHQCTRINENKILILRSNKILYVTDGFRKVSFAILTTKEALEIKLSERSRNKRILTLKQ